MGSGSSLGPEFFVVASQNKFPASASETGAGTGWLLSPGAVTISDDTYASCLLLGGATSKLLYTSSHAFSISSHALGVEVLIELLESAASDNILDVSVWLTTDGSGSQDGDNKANAGEWPTTETVRTYGSPTDTWNLSSLQPGVINSSSFGAAIQCTTAAGGEAKIDSISITVYYTGAEEADLGVMHGPVIRRQTKKVLVAF